MAMRLLATVALAVALSACSKPSDSSLRASFWSQIQGISWVRDFKLNGANEASFLGADGRGGTNARWVVRITDSRIEDFDDQMRPYKGSIQASWVQDGKEVRTNVFGSNLPMGFTQAGLAQVCYALYGKNSGRWNW